MIIPVIFSFPKHSNVEDICNELYEYGYVEYRGTVFRLSNDKCTLLTGPLLQYHDKPIEKDILLLIIEKYIKSKDFEAISCMHGLLEAKNK